MGCDVNESVGFTRRARMGENRTIVACEVWVLAWIYEQDQLAQESPRWGYII
jgi:hypothetical protein